jgi:EAL domain-containing protein (putative c-di-GMP-specific phosphodiesterase class I)
VTALGVALGQGYLLGRPAIEPAAPRPMTTLRLDVARDAAETAIRDRVRRSHRTAAAAGHALGTPVGD